MCKIIVINRGEKEIATPRQFKEHFGFPVDIEVDETGMDCCLCGCDIATLLTGNGIKFKTHWGDFYVGQLDEVVGDGDEPIEPEAPPDKNTLDRLAAELENIEYQKQRNKDKAAESYSAWLIKTLSDFTKRVKAFLN